MEEMYSKLPGLRVLRWTLHGRITLEQAEQKIECYHCSYDPGEGDDLLGTLGRICRWSSEGNQHGCNGYHGTTPTMCILQRS